MKEDDEYGSSLFREAIEAEAVDTMHEGAFLNAIHEYVFRLSREERGLVDCVVVYNAIRQDEIVATRCARVHVIKEKKRYFFFLLAEAWVSNLQDWTIIAKTKFLEGAIRQPNYEHEVIWFEPDEDD